MEATRRELIMQRWNVIQHELLPELRSDVGALTPKREKAIHTLEWVRIGAFSPFRKRPSESTFSRAFDEWSKARLPERVHEALVKDPLGDERIGHIRRDGTALLARERPVQSKAVAVKPVSAPAW